MENRNQFKGILRESRDSLPCWHEQMLASSAWREDQNTIIIYLLLLPYVRFWLFKKKILYWRNPSANQSNGIDNYRNSTTQPKQYLPTAGNQNQRLVDQQGHTQKLNQGRDDEVDGTWVNWLDRKEKTGTICGRGQQNNEWIFHSGEERSATGWVLIWFGGPWAWFQMSLILWMNHFRVRITEREERKEIKRKRVGH